MKVGTVALVGRPNTGKSTLVNNLIGTKVAITSPKPQTTQFPLYAVYQDEDSQIIFVDTPGIFAKADKAKKGINMAAEDVLHNERIDCVLYVIDPTRQKGMEENRVLGVMRKVTLPTFLVINKVDIKEPSYKAQYKFMEEEFDQVFEVSALKHNNLNYLLDAIKEVLKEGDPEVLREDMPTPAINMDANTFLEEIIREKIYLRLRREIPYHTKVVVDEVIERPGNKTTYIRARIITLERYKKMVIGLGGRRIKEIGGMARKELEVATGRKIFLDLFVEEE